MANDLKMRLVLDALDRASRPIKAVSQGSAGLARSLKASREQLKALQTTQNDISSLSKQRESVRLASEELAKAQQRLRGYREQLKAMDAPSAKFQKSFAQAAAQVDKLKAKHGEQRTELQRLVGNLNKAGISTQKLAQGEQALQQRIAQTNKTISEQTQRMQRLSAQHKRLAAARSQYDKTQQLAGSMAGTGAGAAALGASAGLPVLSMAKDYMSFEDAMSGVAKQVAGARDDNGNLTSTYFEMADAIKAMGERIPMATTEIAALVEGAARMGVQGKRDLLAFTGVAANAATAFELPADEIGENLARIADLYKIPIKNVGLLGDAINYLDDNAKSKGADIIEVLQRTAGVTASVGMSYKDAAALGSTFLTLGATAEVAGTATNAMIRELAIATQQPKRFQSGLKALGLEAQALQAGMAKNATGTLQTVLNAINKLPKAEQLSVTTQLFGKEFGDDAAKLAQNIGEYRRQLELANSAAGEGSMQREADIRAQLMSARLQMAQNQAFNLSSALGETLRPTILELVESFNRVVGSVNAWVKANPELAGQIVKTVGGLAMLAAGFGAITLGMASFLGPFAMVRYALTLFGIKSLGAIAALKGMGGALLWAGKAILWVGRALMMNPIGLAVAAIAGAAYLIYKNWAPIKAFFLGLWAEARAAFDQGIGGISKLLLNWSPLGLVYRAFAALMSYLGVDLPAKFSDFGSMMMQGLVNGIKNAAGAVKNAVVSTASDSIDYFKEKLGIHSPSRVFAQLGGFTMQGLEQGLDKGQGGPLAAIASIAKQLTAAGAITFGAAGSAIAMDNRPPLSAVPPHATSAAAAPAPIIIHVHPSAGMDEQALARLVQVELAKAQRAAQTKGRAALSDQE